MLPTVLQEANTHTHTYTLIWQWHEKNNTAIALDKKNYAKQIFMKQAWAPSSELPKRVSASVTVSVLFDYGAFEPVNSVSL